MCFNYLFFKVKQKCIFEKTKNMQHIFGENFFKLLEQFLALSFFGILFLQSSLDKIKNKAENKAYLKSVFAASPLKNSVSFLFPLITLLEFSAGSLSAIGALLIWFGKPAYGFVGILLSCIALLSLFFGQRIAKDYAGAASIAAYFAVALVSLFLFR
jgi:hypothetical protein